MSKKNYIIPIFVPHCGCPHDCVFCNQEEITGVKDKISGEDVLDKIDSYLETIPTNASRIEVAFYGGSFTGIEKKYQKELLNVASKRLKEGSITGIRLSTRPDYISEDILSFLRRYGVTTIELGVQSLDDKVLKASGRGHTKSDTFEALKLIREYQFNLGLQIMPGLPGSDIKSDLETGEEVISLEPDFVRIYPTLVIRKTELAQLYKEGNYAPLILEEAVKVSAHLLKQFKGAKTPVIRIGLQPSEGVNKKEVIAGPFHPSFRQLVESKLILEEIEEGLKELSKIKKLILVVHPKELSNLRGQKNKNISYLKRSYNLEKIEIKEDNALSRDEVKVEYC